MINHQAGLGHPLSRCPNCSQLALWPPVVPVAFSDAPTHDLPFLISDKAAKWGNGPGGRGGTEEWGMETCETGAGASREPLERFGETPRRMQMICKICRPLVISCGSTAWVI